MVNLIIQPHSQPFFSLILLSVFSHLMIEGVEEMRKSVEKKENEEWEESVLLGS